MDFKRFLDLLEKEIWCLDRQNTLLFTNKTSPTDFEKLVEKASINIISSMSLNCKIDYQEGGHSFPDIVYSFDDGFYGLEVKSSTNLKTADNSWIILGNSILGSTKKDVIDTYIIFFKVNKNGKQIKIKRYADCVSDVVVTHSPRYKLDLCQSPEQSFFARSGISYDELKKSDNPIEVVTKYFKELGQTAWWLTQSTPAVIKSWDELDQEIKTQILTKAFILFIELFDEKNTKKYKRLAKWLVANYSIADSSLRDKFSAGGKCDLTLNNKKYPQIHRTFANFLVLKQNFIKELEAIDIEDLMEYWQDYNAKNDTIENRIDFWGKSLLHIIKDYKEQGNYENFLENLLAEINRP